MAVRRILPLGQPPPSYLDFPIPIRSLVASNEISGTETTSDYTSGSFEATTGQLIVVVVQWQNAITSNPYSNPENSVSSSGMSFTFQAGAGNDNPNSAIYAEIFTGIVPSDGSRTITVSCSGQSHRGWVHVFLYDNVDQTTPVRQAKVHALDKDVQNNGAYSFDLDDNPLFRSEVLVASAEDTNGYGIVNLITPGTGWSTILNDWLASASGIFGGLHIISRNNSTSNTISYADIDNSDSGDTYLNLAFAAVEIAAANVFSSNANTYYTYSDARTAWEAYHPSISRTHSIGFGIEGGGSAITVGTKGTIEVPYDFTIGGWTMIADQSGSANVDLWSRDYSTTLPTQANSVTDNIGMTISTATANQSTTISNWRMDKINAGNVITYNVQSCSTITRLMVNLFGTKG